jgi:hypothetical protein
MMTLKYSLLTLFLLAAAETMCGQNSILKNKAVPDTIVPGKKDPQQQLKEIKENKNQTFSDSTDNEPKTDIPLDTTTHNKYGDLLNDDTTYNKKYALWKPVAEAIGVLGVTWVVDRYVINADYARIGPDTWKYNLKNGWEWDADKFGINFIGHPYSGALSYNAGRSNGYNYFASFAFSIGSSAAWEYFGENTRPSYNDIINTPVSGAFLGEVLYRISSNILDDRTRGFHRVIREVTAGIVDPVRGINRLLQGKAFRITNREVYQEEPLNISLLGGIQQRNSELHKVFGAGTTNPTFNIQLDYGNAFEKRSRKPFDFFRLRVDLSFSYGRKIIDNVGGYGLLIGKNKEAGNVGMLAGIFQHYDYWDNYSFELGTIGLGPGVITKLPFNAFGLKNNLYTNFHLAVVPLSGKNKEQGVDSLAIMRDYNFGGGGEAKLEATLNLGEIATIALNAYYYYVHTYSGTSENAWLGILKPKIYFNIYHHINIGFEHTIQNEDSYSSIFPDIHAARTEQKIFVMIYLEDKQRKGRYN